MSVVVREALPAEHAELGEIVVAAYRAAGALAGDEEYVPALRDVAGRARDALVLAAVDGETGALLGCLTYVGDHRSPLAEGAQAGEAAIRMLGVAPAAQGRGAGTALASAAVARARAEGRRAVVLHSQPIMASAQRIYGRLGFRRDPGRDWSAPGIVLLAFRLDLR